MIDLAETDFYLTGGTALSRVYLKHRYSDDLDFFINNSNKFSTFVNKINNILTKQYKEKIASLDYNTERQRVVSYWRDIVNEFKTFNVPERKFNEMAMSVIPHIRMSTTKDPKSGLFMVPAATFGYQVYSNESAFQSVLLDKIGDHQTSAKYLETFLKLQGTDPMPGTFTGDQSAVFHGGKVDEEYNYTSGLYNLDHGTVLWALGQHYLLSRDSDWFNRASSKILRAAEWIIEQRNQTAPEEKNSGKNNSKNNQQNGYENYHFLFWIFNRIII